MPPYFRLVRGVGLLERLEDDLLFFHGMPMPLSVTSNATTAGAWLQHRMLPAPSANAAETLSRTPPWAVNLNAFESRFLSTCCRRLVLVVMVRPRFGSTCTSNESWRGIGLMAERPSHHVKQVGKEDVLGIDGDGARLDL